MQYQQAKILLYVEIKFFISLFDDFIFLPL